MFKAAGAKKFHKIFSHSSPRHKTKNFFSSFRVGREEKLTKKLSINFFLSKNYSPSFCCVFNIFSHVSELFVLFVSSSWERVELNDEEAEYAFRVQSGVARSVSDVDGGGRKAFCFGNLSLKNFWFKKLKVLWVRWCYEGDGVFFMSKSFGVTWNCSTRSWNVMSSQLLWSRIGFDVMTKVEFSCIVSKP